MNTYLIFNCEGKAQKTSYNGREFPGSLVIGTLHFHFAGTSSVPGGGMKIPQTIWHGKKKRKKIIIISEENNICQL